MWYVLIPAHTYICTPREIKIQPGAGWGSLVQTAQAGSRPQWTYFAYCALRWRATLQIKYNYQQIWLQGLISAFITGSIFLLCRREESSFLSKHFWAAVKYAQGTMHPSDEATFSPVGGRSNPIWMASLVAPPALHPSHPSLLSVRLFSYTQFLQKRKQLRSVLLFIEHLLSIICVNLNM